MGQRGRYSLTISSGSAPSRDATVRDRPDPLEIAVAWLRAVEVRNRALDPELAAEPAWNMLLDLYAQHRTGNRISVTSVCLSAGVPESTALRWLGVLLKAGVARRTPDPADGRRHFVELTALGVERMERALGALSD